LHEDEDIEEVEVAYIRQLDPGALPLHHFGAELRRLREAAELTLDQLGKIVHLTSSMIGQVETAAKAPKDEHVPRLDAALGADEALMRAGEPARHSQLSHLLSHRNTKRMQIQLLPFSTEFMRASAARSRSSCTRTNRATAVERATSVSTKP
jgi:transcriptional regulator with XRE-family HTH domain